MCKGLRLEGDWDSKDWYPTALIQDHCGWEMNLMVRTELAFKLFDRIYIIKNLHSNGLFSVADPGCLSRIPDPTFFHPGSRIRTVSIPDPGS